MWFVKNLFGIFCSLLVYLVMFTVSGVVYTICIRPLSEDNYLNNIACIIPYTALLGLAILCHWTCMFTNPGTLPQNTALDCARALKNGTKAPGNYCTRCQLLKPIRTHHCSTCNRCIQKMDHHCWWVNNCVGMYNQKHFILFLFYTILACVFSFILLSIRAAYCPTHQKSTYCKNLNQDEMHADMLCGILAFFLGILFFIFCFIMLFDQITCIIKNTSVIEKLQQNTVEERSAKQNFQEAFGGQFSIWWFLPTKIKSVPLSNTLEDSAIEGQY